MKKILAITAIIIVMAVSCGPRQQKAEVEQVDTTATELVDSTVVDTLKVTPVVAE